MSVETAADRAAMFADSGEAALYTPPAPGADPIPCAIVYHRGRPKPFELGPGGESGMRGAYAKQAALLLADQVPLVEQRGRLVPGAVVDDVFVPGPDALTVVGRPELDETGAIWTVDLQKD